MDNDAKEKALVTAITTEHFVLQTAASSTVAEAGNRSSLYVMSLSSALVATGFVSQSKSMFMPFVATVLPAVFVLGVFTIVRLIDTSLEDLQYLAGIARIRDFYRSLELEPSNIFAKDVSRWPELTSGPALSQGKLVAFLGTTASMIAFLNNLVAGAAVTLTINWMLGGDRLGVALAGGVAVAVVLMLLYLSYQKRRFARTMRALGQQL